MNNRWFFLLLVVFGAVLTVSAQDTETEPWVCPDGYAGQTLNIFNWATYIGEQTVPNFEDACGVTVNYDTYDSNETMINRIRLGNPGYDIVIPSAYALEIMARDELLIPLDKDIITSIDNINPNFLNLPNDPDNVYGVPYLTATIGVGYNTEIFPDGITSWEQVWEHDGPVAWIDDRRAMFGIALLMMGLDPNTDDIAEIEMARDYLLERSGNVIAIAADDGQALLQRGDVDIAIEYNGDILSLIAECECEDFAYAVPDEGSSFYAESVSVPVDGQNTELAMVFIEYLLDPAVAAEISTFTAYATPNQEALDGGFIPEADLNNPAIYPPEEILENLFLPIEVGADAEQAYSDAWSELLIFVGQ